MSRSGGQSEAIPPVFNPPSSYPGKFRYCKDASKMNRTYKFVFKVGSTDWTGVASGQKGAGGSKIFGKRDRCQLPMDRC
ncbi:hypothetical protein TNCV_652541 [Trichonephila clavipes]|nr:hypothetical protein TNCV_652541 [Trichonephila clavipes]